MSQKTIIYIGIAIFGALGGFLGGKLDNGNIFGVWGIIGSTVGGLFGIWAAVKVSSTDI